VYPLQYKFNGKSVVIPDAEIDKLVSSLEISQQEAIELWLCDNGYDEDEEQEKLDETAKKVHIMKDITPKTAKKERKHVVKAVSDEKKTLFSEILSNLQYDYDEDVEVLNENKLISVKIGDKTFKIDVIEQRQPKNK
jgi:hypothetical protein